MIESAQLGLIANSFTTDIDYLDGINSMINGLISQSLSSFGGFWDILSVAQNAHTTAMPLLAEIDEAEVGPLVITGVLLSLITVFIAAKVGGELCARLNLPSVLGELIGGVVVGVSALNLIIFPEGGEMATSALMNVIQMTAHLEMQKALRRSLAAKAKPSMY